MPCIVIRLPVILVGSANPYLCLDKLKKYREQLCSGKLIFIILHKIKYTFGKIRVNKGRQLENLIKISLVFCRIF